MFTTDYKNENENILPEGEYECIILSAILNVTKGGTEYFSVRFAVRNDVPQKYQNKNIYHAIWRRKLENRTADDDKVDGFSFKQIMNLCRAAGLPKGKSYDSIDALGEDLKNKCVLITIEHNEYNGEVQERVKWTNSTRFPECRHTVKQRVQQETAAKSTNAGYTEISSDDDLPF